MAYLHVVNLLVHVHSISLVGFLFNIKEVALLHSAKYFVMHKVQVHNKTISYLVYGSCVCTDDNPLAKARGLSSHTDGRTIH